MLSREELEQLRTLAHKSMAFGDGTVRIDAGDLSMLADYVLDVLEAQKYDQEIRDTKQSNFWGN